MRIPLSISFIAIAVAIGLTVARMRRDPDSAQDARTPVAAVEFLEQHPELANHGLLLNTYNLGDYLIWKLHSNKFRFMVASHVHLIPPDVWQDYLAISRRRENWHRVVDKYAFKVAVLARWRHRKVIHDLTERHGWKVKFRGDVAVVLTHPDLQIPTN